MVYCSLRPGVRLETRQLRKLLSKLLFVVFKYKSLLIKFAFPSRGLRKNNAETCAVVEIPAVSLLQIFKLDRTILLK